MITADKKRNGHADVAALCDPLVANRFADTINEATDLNLWDVGLMDAFHSAADAVLPKLVATSRRPWVSSKTLQLRKE